MNPTSNATVCAHLFKNSKVRGGGYELLITQGPSIVAEYILARVSPVPGKREANKLAKQYGAIPHNF